ncbi:phosphoglucosamine mutase [Salsipaludibacter albus]|uniref:phosphoglucosamine mutase n=1 Tax=Salsipaludibacter albus TaxID=2849650 RepID=UPI001EE4E80E|nr:phosphoglucosamine mutase [Salsipaludibacter albus]MBY5161601.1 phosphoglucosamine mutase [Salsipaludibacter albus]
MGRIFGTDGVRGRANTDITPEFALHLGRQVVRVLREESSERPTIVLGRDPRWSSPMLAAALSAGMNSAGGDVVDLGVVTTPGVAHATASTDAAAGAVVSASHNPMPDNGIKFFGRDGFKLTDGEESRLEMLLSRPDGRSGRDAPRPVGTDLGTTRVDTALVTAYLDHLVDLGTPLDGITMVVDCANGAASALAPVAYERLGARVVTLHAEPDGSNINDNCGSTHPESLQAAVVEHGADLGVAHDGDADRLIAVDADGAEVDGDVILAMLAVAARDAGDLVDDTVVTTVMTNLGFRRAMDAHGITVVETRVGDRYVLEALREQGVTLGGEQSGHVIDLRHGTTGDGIQTAIQMMGVMAGSGRSLADLATVMERLPQVLVNVEGVDKHRLADAAAVEDVIAEVEQELGDAGRVLVRSSGTEPIIRVMVEARTSAQASGAADRIADVVRSTLSLDEAV